MREIELRKLTQKGIFELFPYYFLLIKLSVMRLDTICI